jgi:hypothetical protein
VVRGDDLLLFGDTKGTLWEWRQAIVERLGRLRLQLHPAAHPIPVGEGIPFLGFRVFPHRRRVKARKGLYFRRTLVGLVKEHRAGRRTTEDVSARVRGWINHVRCTNSVGLRKAVFRYAVAQVGPV